MWAELEREQESQVSSCNAEWKKEKRNYAFFLIYLVTEPLFRSPHPHPISNLVSREGILTDLCLWSFGL